MTITLSNPVVFFTLGSASEFAPVLGEALGCYIERAALVTVPEEFDDRQIRGEVSRVWREFLDSGVAKAEIIRANFIVNADESAYYLPGLLAYADKYFSALYPGGCLIDVYCLMDDVELLDDSRGIIMKMLRHIRESYERVYILSNVTTEVLPLTRIAQTMALLTLFKDCTPSLATGADASRYNEFFFMENCAMQGGEFLTAGCRTLEVPRDALKALIVAEILEYGRGTLSSAPDNGGADEQQPLLPPKKPVKSIEYLYGFAVPEFDMKDELSRGMWLSRLFGQRLGQVASEYSIQEVSEVEITNVYDLTRQAGEAENAAAALAAAQDDLQEREESFAEWLATRPDFGKNSPEAAVRKLSPIQNQPLFPYVLASNFLKKQAEIQFAKEKVKVLKRRHQTTERFREKLGGHISEADEVIAARGEKIAQLDATFRPFAEVAASDYFRKKFAEYAAKHREDMLRLSKKMAEDLLGGNFENYVTRLEKYIEVNILPAPEFNEPISKILRELAGSGNIAEAIVEWQKVNHGVRLKTGYANLHAEANFVYPEAKIAAEVKKLYEARGLGRMNIFPIKSARMALMYHAGAFDAAELFYVDDDDDEEQV